MKVSVIIPSRNERFLVPTVEEVLRQARGDIEVIVVLDGYWEHGLPPDPRLHVLHQGAPQGMRPAINAAAAVAKGDYLMKLDAHCMVGEAFDEILMAECDPTWVVVPRRYPLDPEKWQIQDNGKIPIDYHYLSYPLARRDPYLGLHGSPWRARSVGREDILLDDEMSSQGSCWFMARSQWDRIGPLDVAAYGNFIQEFQEIGLKAWLGGGAVKVNKRTWYAHLHKGRKYGRGYWISQQENNAGADYAMKHWMLDRWEGAVRPLRWLVEKFAPVPTWPEDLDAAFAAAREAFA